MSIVPDHGVLNAGKAERVNVSLRRSQDASEARELNGIWFTARVGGSDTLIPIFMNTQLSQPCIDIDFGAGAIQKGRHVCIPLWPSSDSQDLRWLIRCIDPAIKLVAVSVISQGGESLVSQPIALKGDQSVLISFPPPKPVEPNHSSPKSFEGPLTVIVSDSKDGKPLGSWQVTTQIGDPRTMLQPGTAEYVIRDDGTNRIRVDVEHLTKFDTRPVLDFAPIVRLELESAASQSRSLIDIGNSKLQAVIKDGQSPTTLYAENLRFIEGAPAMMMIPLSINGDCGYFELEWRFPRRSGTVKLS